MYEEYTDEQIVEMLIPKLKKSVPELNWDEYLKRPDAFSIWNRLISVIYKSGYVRGQLGRSFIIGEKKAKEPVSVFKVGDKVKFLGFNLKGEVALNNRGFFPHVGTIGEIVETGLVYCFVRWPQGTVSGDRVWSCRNKYLKKHEEKWVPATNANLNKGAKVRYLNDISHTQHPEFYPEPGTVGEVRCVCKDNTCLVLWSCFNVDWYARWDDLEVLVCE